MSKRNQASSCVRCARSGTSSPFGKRDTPVKTFLPGDIVDDVDKIATANGMSRSEFIADLIIGRVRGRDAVQSMYNRRLDAILGTG